MKAFAKKISHAAPLVLSAIALFALWGASYSFFPGNGLVAKAVGPAAPDSSIMTDGIYAPAAAVPDLNSPVYYKFSAGEYLTFDFGSVKKVARIVMQADTAAEYKAYASVDGSSFGSPVATLYAGSQYRDSGYFNETNARYVRLIPDASGAIAEVEFKTALNGAANLFFGMKPGYSSGPAAATLLPVARDAIAQWANEMISAVTPGGSSYAGPVLSAPGKVNVRVAGQYGNELSFSVAPRVQSISPSEGPAGTWVTIRGSGFGNAGTVDFVACIASVATSAGGIVDCPEDKQIVMPALPLPGYCAATWTDSQIIAKAPAPFSNVKAAFVRVNAASSGVSSPLVDTGLFTFTNGPLPPKICGVALVKAAPAYSLVAGANAKDAITVVGENLTSGLPNATATLVAGNQGSDAKAVTLAGNVPSLSTLVINENNFTGDVYVTRAATKKSSKAFCPVSAVSGTVTFAGNQHVAGMPEAGSYADGPLYNKNASLDAAAPGQGMVSLTGDKANAAVSYNSAADVQCAGKICGRFRYPLKIDATAFVQTKAVLFHFGKDIQGEVPNDAVLSNVFVNGAASAQPLAKRTVAVTVNLLDAAGQSLKTGTLAVPPSGVPVEFSADYGSLPAGQYFLEIIQNDSYSFTCGNCGVSGTPSSYRSNLGVASVSFTTVTGAEIGGKCVSADGKVVPPGPIDVPTTLTSNALRLSINEAGLQKTMSLYYSSPADAAAASCPNASIVARFRTPCPAGAREANPANPGEYCVDSFGNYVGRSVANDGGDSFALFRVGNAIACGSGESPVFAEEKAKYGLGASSYCKVDGSYGIGDVKGSQYPALNAGAELTFWPSVTLVPSQQYEARAYYGNCPSGQSCAHYARGFTSAAPKIVTAAGFSSVKFATAASECKVRRIDVSPASLAFQDTSTPLFVSIRAFSQPKAGMAGDIELNQNSLSISSVLDSAAAGFATLGGGSSNAPVLTPRLSGSSQDQGYSGTMTVRATYGAAAAARDAKNASDPDAQAVIPVSANACDLPWSFIDKELNFRLSYCTGNRASDKNLPTLGSGTGDFDETGLAQAGIVGRTANPDDVAKDSKGGISSFLKEFLFPVNPPSSAAGAAATIPGSNREGLKPAEDCSRPELCNVTGYAGTGASSFYTLNGKNYANGKIATEWPRYKVTAGTGTSLKVVANVGTVFPDMSQSSQCAATAEGTIAARYKKKGLALGTKFDPAGVDGASLPTTGIYTGFAKYRFTLMNGDGSFSALNRVSVSRPLGPSSEDVPVSFSGLTPGAAYYLKVELENWYDSSIRMDACADGSASCIPAAVENCSPTMPIPVVKYGLTVNSIRAYDVPSVSLVDFLRRPWVSLLASARRVL